MNNRVQSLTIYEGDLIVGGNFSVAGGQSAHKIARWNGSGWQALGSGMGDSASWVLALTVFNGDLIAGGGFTNAGGQDAVKIARWNGAEWLPLGAGMDEQDNSFPEVKALCVYNGELIAGGLFDTAGGRIAKDIARWNGSAWAALDSGMNSWVNVLTIYNGELIAGGNFTTAGGQAANRIARWNGTTWQPLSSGLVGPLGEYSAVAALTVYNDDLIVGGSFTIAGGQSATNIARWDGSAWHPLQAGYVQDVLALAVYDAQLYAGFLAPGVYGIARWTGSNWQDLPGAIDGGDGLIDALMIFKGDLIVGGDFETIGRLRFDDIAAWHNCPFCPGDINGDGVVNHIDILAVTNAWGSCPAPTMCFGDIAPPGGDGQVNVDDLLAIINSWGPCP